MVKKYRHRVTGEIIVEHEEGYSPPDRKKTIIFFVPKEWVEDSTDWEEIIECKHSDTITKRYVVFCKQCNCTIGLIGKSSEPKKDYEILSWDKCGDIFTHDDVKKYDLRGDFNIHSVKRLSDGSKDDA